MQCLCFWWPVLCSCILSASVFACLGAHCCHFIATCMVRHKGCSKSTSLFSLSWVGMWNVVRCALLFEVGWRVKRRMHIKYCTQNCVLTCSKNHPCVSFVWCWCSSWIIVSFLKKFCSILNLGLIIWMWIFLVLLLTYLFPLALRLLLLLVYSVICPKTSCCLEMMTRILWCSYRLSQGSRNELGPHITESFPLQEPRGSCKNSISVLTTVQ